MKLQFAIALLIFGCGGPDIEELIINGQNGDLRVALYKGFSEQKSADGTPFIGIAVRSDNREAIEAFAKYQWDFNLKGQDGYTAGREFESCDHGSVAPLFVKYGGTISQETCKKCLGVALSTNSISDIRGSAAMIAAQCDITSASANAVLSQIEKDRRNQQLQKEREQEKELAKLQAEARVTAARNLRTQFLDNGKNVIVKANGTTLHFEWILIDEVFIHHFRKSKAFEDASKIGFTKMVFSNGQSHWTLDL